MNILSALNNKVKQVINSLNEAGVPIPLARINGAPTLTGSMVVISFTTCVIGQLGKISGFLGGVDLTQANYLLVICLSAYLGRKMQGNGSTKEVSLGDKESQDK
jgi:hypothetical protein